MEELRERAVDETQVEDMKQSYKKENQDARGEKSDDRKHDGQSGKNGGFRLREPPKGPCFQQYTLLNAPRAKILQEALTTDLMLVPKRRPTPPRADDNKHCLYHKNMGHTTEECVNLKDKIEELIQVGQLKKYVKVERPTEHPTCHPRSPRRSPPRHEDQCPRCGRIDQLRYERNDSPCSEWRSNRSHSRSNDQPLCGHINTISGGFTSRGSSSSACKRHVEDYAAHDLHRQRLRCPRLGPRRPNGYHDRSTKVARSTYSTRRNSRRWISLKTLLSRTTSK